MLDVLFTFQSGDIQMYMRDREVAGLSILFTFQSGDIQIMLTLMIFLVLVFIYIPIW